MNTDINTAMNVNKLVQKNIQVLRKDFELNISELILLENKVNVILGENGAGKSTLLNYIIESQNAFGSKRKVLLTQTSYTFNKSCLKNIEMVLSWNKSNDNPLKYLKIVELENKKDTIGKNLSGGEKKRLAFAMALATNAEIILLDEPFANVDVKNQKKLIEIIKSLKNEKTVVVVSHRENICKDIGDYFMQLEEGALVKRGDISSFFN